MARRCYGWYLSIIPCILWAVLTSAAWASSAKGPLNVRNQYPPHLMFLTPKPEAPRLPGKNRFDLSFAADYSSVYIYEKTQEWTVLIDMEMTVLEFSLEYGLSDRLSLALDLPFVSMNGGGLDSFMEDFHDTFGLPNYGREDRPKNEFAYFIRKEGQEWFRAQDGGLHLTDSTLSVKFLLSEGKKGQPFTTALSYTLKLPFGDEDEGFGSGKFDHGISLLSQFRLAPFTLYLTPGFFILSDPDTAGADISARNVFSLFLGGEYALNQNVSLLAQLNYYTSPMDEDTGIDQLDEDSLELGLGLVWQITPATCFELAFCEDLTRAAPDFNLHLAFNYTFGN